METNVVNWIQENVFLIVILVCWELAWKLFVLWKSARNKQTAWFVILGILNTLGVLPVIYLLIERNKLKPEKTF